MRRLKATAPRTQTMKHVVIINHNAGAPQYGPNYRSYYVARSLRAQGYRTSIVASSFSHKFHTLPKVDGGVSRSVSRESIDGIEYYWLRCRPFRGTFGRVANYYGFAGKLKGLASIVAGDPDVVICSSPPPLWIWQARDYARRFGAKLVFEARDLWPQVVLDTMRLARLNPLTYVIAAAERFAYGNADAVVSVSPASKAYMVARGLPPERFACIPNGLDLQQPSPREEPLPEPAGRPRANGTFRLGYVGAFGKSYGLQHLVRAASLLKDQPVSFLLVGDGPASKRLKAQARGLSNVTFADRIAKRQVPAVLADLDAGFASFLDRPAFRYGGNQNKIYDYMAASKPIIYALNSEFNPVAEADCGLTIAPENPQAIADAVMTLVRAGADDRRRWGENGRRYLQQHHGYQRLGKLWAELIESL